MLPALLPPTRLRLAALGVTAVAFAAFPLRAAEPPLAVPSCTPGLTRTARLALADEGAASHAVLLLPVAGPTDVDMSLGARGIYSAVAERLAEAGVASLRIADRGVDGSGGDWRQTDFETRVADAAAALAWLRDQSELAGAEIGALGVSEGGAIALALATAPEGPDFVVALSTPIEDGLTVLRGQRDRLLERSAMPAEHIEIVRSESERFLRAVVDGDETAVRSVLIGRAGHLILPPYQFVPRDEQGRIDFALSPWYRSQVTFDVADRVRGVRVPVFAAYGSLDQVIDAPGSAARVRDLLRDAGGGEVQVRLIEGLNHLMMPAVTGSPLEYGQLPDILSVELWDEIAAWIRRH